MSTAALLCLCTELRCLQITPDDKELVLAEGSSLSLTCSGSGETSWEFKRDDVPYFQVEQVQNGGQSYQIIQSGRNTSSVLTLRNVSWKHTGVYQCIDRSTAEAKEVAVFVPGESWLCLHVIELFSVIQLVTAASVCFHKQEHHSISFMKLQKKSQFHTTYQFSAGL